jgi:hypothetical protein
MSFPDLERAPLRPFDLTCFFYAESASGVSMYDGARTSGARQGGLDTAASNMPLSRVAYWDPKSRRWCAPDG